MAASEPLGVVVFFPAGGRFSSRLWALLVCLVAAGMGRAPVRALPFYAGAARRRMSGLVGRDYPSCVDGEGPGQQSVWDRIAVIYGLAGPQQFSEFARRLVSLVPLGTAAPVLDLACGAGALAAAAASAVPAVNVVAVDLSVEMLRRAASGLRRRGVRHAVAAMNAQSLGFADRTFGAVLCGSALDSFPDPGQALAEAHRVLRPGGVLGLWVAPGWWWQGDPRWTWHDDLLVSLGVDVGRVPVGFDGPVSLHQMICAAGFGSVHVRAEEMDLCFLNADEWWGWAWSHGFRQVMEQLAADQLAVYQRTAFQRIQPGGIDGRMQALVATAVCREH